MAFIEMEGIWRRFPGVVALSNVSLSIELGRVHVLAGENGAGKSTLVKILTGTLKPSDGRVVIDGRSVEDDPGLFGYVAYVPQELSLFPHMTVAENLFIPFNKSGTARLAIDHGALNREAWEYIERFNISARPEQMVKNIPISDQQLLQIARASTNRGFKVLILDEPTSSLTGKETERLFGIIRQLRDTGHAIIFISHRLEETFALGDEVTVLRNGEHVGHRDMDGLTIPELVHMMSGEEVKIDQNFQPGGEAGRVLLEVEHLSGRNFQDISFVLRQGEILGFAGLVGAGRSEVMQTMFGYLKATGGRVIVDGQPWKLNDTTHSTRHGMLYLSEERRLHGILPFLSVRDNIGISIFDQTVSGGVISSGKEIQAVRDIVDRYEIKTSSIAKLIMFLSGGNQQKAIIGRAMAQHPKVLIFDEPTKGIDVKTKAEIYKIMKTLAESGVGIILVSSDMDELRRCASRIITMYRGSIRGEFVTRETDHRTLVGAILGTGEVRHVA